MTDVAYAPRYREIEAALRVRISALRPGQRLPSDADLCAEFGVSRMTARHAMAQLAEEGLVRRDPGRGTFVAEPPTHRRANSLMTFSHEMRRQGRQPSSVVVRREVRAPLNGEREELRVGRGGEVVEVRRVRLADETPVALETAVLTARCIEAVMDADLENGSLHEALIGHDIVPTRGTSSIGAEAATAEDAALLGVTPGEPMLVERRLIVDQRGRPVERTESRYAADRYGLNVAFSVEDSGALTAAPGTGNAGSTGPQG